MARGGSGTHGRISDTVNLKQLMLGSTLDNVAGTFRSSGVAMAEVQPGPIDSRRAAKTPCQTCPSKHAQNFRKTRGESRDKVLKDTGGSRDTHGTHGRTRTGARHVQGANLCNKDSTDAHDMSRCTPPPT
jgi:hypothetical protein